MSGAGVWDFISKVVGSEATIWSSLNSWDKAKEGFAGQQKTIDEQQRRLGLERDRIMSDATSQVAASGLALDSPSIQNSLASMRSEMERQAAWTRTAKETDLQKAREANDWKLGMSIIGSIFDLGGTVGSYAAAGNTSTNTDPSGSDLSSEYAKIWSNYSNDQQNLQSWNWQQSMSGAGAGDFGGWGGGAGV